MKKLLLFFNKSPIYNSFLQLFFYIIPDFRTFFIDRYQYLNGADGMS